MPPLTIKLEYTRHFIRERKKYLKNYPKRFVDYKKAVILFVSNPSHTSLNLEKIRNAKGVYTAIFIDIGKHDKYRRY